MFLTLVGLLAILFLVTEPALAAKRVYRAKLKGQGVTGTAVLATNVNGSAWDFMVYARNVNNSVKEVWLVDQTEGNSLPLCGVLGAAEAICTHDGDGNLDLSGSITSGVAHIWGWGGAAFRDALDNGRTELLLYNEGGALLASGAFVRIFP
jgi:hypothetical protein